VLANTRSTIRQPGRADPGAKLLAAGVVLVAGSGCGDQTDVHDTAEELR
jgi:hypothetical protein